MIEQIKEKIWALLKDKEVSLVMIFDDRGEILWHRGRKIIETRSLAKGCGYCSTPSYQAIRDRKKFRKNECQISYFSLQAIDSARSLRIKSLIILPIADSYFLYVDSGVKEGFSEKDIAVFDTLGSILGGIIQNLRSGAGDAKKVSGHSDRAAAVREKIAKYAIEEEPVLLLGETGVGKSHVAEMIHTYSGRKGTFVVVNTPGIPDTLLEAQLFGHVKGAFSGAVGENEGFISAAEGGTLFLDEIAELQPSLQAKLLRFMDSKMYTRLGESKERKADTRVLAATNQDLTAAIARKTFREDLFFRLNCLAIEIPPLRERRGDILDIIAENQPLLRGKILTDAAREILLSYDWPGNVRELIQVLKVAGIQFTQKEIGPEVSELLMFRTRPVLQESTKIERVWQEMQSGKTFWEAVKMPFLQRDLNRDEVMEILSRGLKLAKGKYIRLLKLFNLKQSEYKNFMRFLYENRLKQ